MIRKHLLLFTSLIAISAIACAETKQIPITFTGGHETDPRDHGRPVVLVAAALGVAPEVFRKAFSGVHPAQGRGPTPEEAQRNKDALLSVLGPYGITNDQLDEASNFYRYRPESGRLWRHRDAEGIATVVDGKVVSIKLTQPGWGYSSAPVAQVVGFERVPIRVQVSYSKQFEKNGSITVLALTKR